MIEIIDRLLVRKASRLCWCILAFAPIVLQVASARGDELSRWEARAEKVTIRRDLFGVPHIYAPTDADCVFGFMYARGEVNRLQRPDPSRIPPGFTMPASVFDDDAPSIPHGGANALAGIAYFLMSVPSAHMYIDNPATTLRRRYGVHGHSYLAVVELRKPEQGGVRAKSIVPFGSSRNPDTKHYFDQAPLYSTGQLKSAWFTKEEILTNLEREYHPGD